MDWAARAAEILLDLARSEWDLVTADAVRALGRLGRAPELDVVLNDVTMARSRLRWIAAQQVGADHPGAAAIWEFVFDHSVWVEDRVDAGVLLHRAGLRDDVLAVFTELARDHVGRGCIADGLEAIGAAGPAAAAYLRSIRAAPDQEGWGRTAVEGLARLREVSALRQVAAEAAVSSELRALAGRYADRLDGLPMWSEASAVVLEAGVAADPTSIDAALPAWEALRLRGLHEEAVDLLRGGSRGLTDYERAMALVDLGRMTDADPILLRVIADASDDQPWSPEDAAAVLAGFGRVDELRALLSAATPPVQRRAAALALTWHGHAAEGLQALGECAAGGLQVADHLRTAEQLAEAGAASAPPRPWPASPAAPRPTMAPLRSVEPHSLILGHTSPISRVAFDPAGTRLVTAGDGDGTVRLWDRSTGSSIATLDNGHHPLAFTEDGSQLITVGSTGEYGGHVATDVLRRWNALDGSAVGDPLAAPGRMVDIAIRGRVAAGCVDEGPVYVWDTDRGDVLCTLGPPMADASTVVWSPDGELLACAGGGVEHPVRVWRRTGGLARILVGGWTWDDALAFSPDGRRLALGSWARAGSDWLRVVRIWDLRDGRLVAVLCGEPGARRAESDVAWSPDGELITGAFRAGELALWRAATGERVGVLPGAGPVAFSADGTWLATATAQPEIVQVWRLDRS